jgi:hypothetical protein
MAIPKVTPVVSPLTDEELRALERASESHSVPFGAMRVDAFSKELIREAFAQYFDPDYSDPRERFRDENVERESTALFQMLSNVVPQGLWNPEFAAKDFSEVMVSVRILITYPLAEVWEATVEIPASRFGSVFAITHDMYRHIYDLDDAEWQKQGHQDSAPRLAPKMLNRAKGTHVWGHDMSDLVFEWLAFTPNPEWPKVQRKKMRVLKMGESVPKEPEFEEVLEPLDAEKHKGESPFLGTVTFFIGS